MRSAARRVPLVQIDTRPDAFDFVVGLAGNPNTGKSTVFNALTGLRQHTGNWPGKTVARAEGRFEVGGERFKLVDLPGTYSLAAGSVDEEVARDFLLFGRPDVTVVVLDATRLERNLNLALQVLEITDRVVVCLNLMDEARRHGIGIDSRALERELGVPVVAASARRGEGIEDLRRALREVARGERRTRPLRIARHGPEVHDHVTQARYETAEAIAARVSLDGLARARFDLDRILDRILTSRVLGFPTMILMLAVVFWITIAGANAPSSWLASVLVDRIHPALRELASSASFPWWATGILVDGVYLATAWVVSVMLPPMAIFFPLFTLLEDFGYLPRVAFNLDPLFRRAGAHGKQALTMCMGFGCNAAGVVATRVIDSPRERLVAIITNNFSLCNGRWPTQILIASVFLGGLAPPALAGAVAASAVVAVTLLGVAAALVSSWALTRSSLRGEPTSFSLELPPYRPPRILQTLYTSLVDRTIIVLWRAVVFAAPAGAVIWLLGNVSVGGATLAHHLVGGLDPLGVLVGLNGVILLAYLVAIPANEIVIPTILMLTVLVRGLDGVGAGAGVMFELDDIGEVETLLRGAGWTALTGVNLMLFSLFHNPCSTTIYTIYKETRSARWTAISVALPLAIGLAVCLVVAGVWRIVAGS